MEGEREGGRGEEGRREGGREGRREDGTCKGEREGARIWRANKAEVSPDNWSAFWTVMKPPWPCSQAPGQHYARV